MKKTIFHIIVFALFFSVSSIAEQSSISDDIQRLAGAKLKNIPKIIRDLEAKNDDSLLPVFQDMLAGNLYYQRSDKKIIVAIKEGSEYEIFDVFSKESIGRVSKKKIKKVRTNNKVRSQLRSVISRLSLSSEQRDVRIKAVRNMLDQANANNIPLLVEAQKNEKDTEILRLIELALAVNTLTHSEDKKNRVAALKTMQGSLEPTVRNAVVALLEKDDNDEFIEKNEELIKSAQRLMKTIEGKVAFYGWVETLFFGLSLGSVLLLVATGLAITFGVMGVINMAHGELIMLGAYTTYVIQQLFPQYIEYSVLIAIPAAFIVSGSVGILIERGVIRFLHGRPLETLLATFGISLILQQLVRTIFSPLNRQVETPMWMSGSFEINSVLSITYNRFYIIIFALLVFLVLQLVLKKTSLGLHVRAVSQNRSMAKAIGIRTEWVDAMTFGLGSGVAGIAGVALSQLTNVGPNLGQSYIIDSFMVVVFGGVGNLWGTLVGGFSLGVANKFLEPATGAVLANIIVLIFIILFIQKRPTGLFPQKGRAPQ